MRTVQVHWMILVLVSAGTYVLSVAKPAAIPAAKYSVTIDNVIDATEVQHFTFASKRQCLTPDSKSYCWETKPEIEVQ